MTPPLAAPPSACDHLQTRTFQRACIDLQRNEHGPGSGCSDGVRTIAELAEFNARRNPHHVFCIQAVKSTGNSGEQPGLVPVTHLQLKQAVLRCSKKLSSKIPGCSPPSIRDGQVEKSPPVALFMESDVGLLIHLLALLGQGVPVLLLSARLSAAAVKNLLNEASSKTIVASSKTKAVAVEAVSLYDDPQYAPVLSFGDSFETLLVPSPSEIASVDTDLYSICSAGHYVESKDRNVVILHSSGTTGLPKAIPCSHNYLLGYAASHDFENETEALRPNLSTLPLYHGFGFVGAFLSMSIGKTCVLPVSSTISTGSNVVALLEQTKASSLMTVPSILEDINSLFHGDGKATLAKLDFAACGGGPLKVSVGEELSSAGVRILNSYGITEVGALNSMYVPRENHDWHYFRLRKDLILRMDPVGASVESKGQQEHRLSVVPFGWNDRFEAHDRLIRKSETTSLDFRTVGRNDDLLGLANGEKVMPNMLETALNACDLIKTAVVFGEGQFELGVLIEPATPLSVDEYAAFKARVWPIVRAVGKILDRHARILSQDAIAILPVGAQIPRSDKGSVLRREVYSTFETLILETYQKLNSFSANEVGFDSNSEGLEASLKALIQTRLAWEVPSDQWTPDSDLFELGMDSLQANHLRRMLLSAQALITPDGVATAPLAVDFVYHHPSVAQMAAALRSTHVPIEATQDREADISYYTEKYKKTTLQTTGELVSQGQTSVANPQGLVVLLTGSTGSLGAHLLHRLVKSAKVSRIICLNRIGSGEAIERQKKSNTDKAITFDSADWDKVQMLQTNASQPMLGLDPSEYNSLVHQVTHVLHNAWPMDFKRPLRSFESQFQVLKNLLELAETAHVSRPALRVNFVFLSSIATVCYYSNVQGTPIVPELPVTDSKYAKRGGYPEAKLVCERMVEQAASALPEALNVAIVRIGQIAGSSSSGYWNSHEHIPAMVRSSQMLGKLPDLSGTLAWLPVDTTASVLSEIALEDNRPSLHFHLENPNRQNWSDVLDTLASRLRLTSKHIVPYEKWLSDMHDLADKGIETPVTQLRSFFEEEFEHMSGGSVVLDTTNAKACSATLREATAVDQDMISTFVDRWSAIGFLE